MPKIKPLFITTAHEELVRLARANSRENPPQEVMEALQRRERIKGVNGLSEEERKTVKKFALAYVWFGDPKSTEKILTEVDIKIDWGTPENKAFVEKGYESIARRMILVMRVSGERAVTDHMEQLKCMRDTTGIELNDLMHANIVLQIAKGSNPRQVLKTLVSYIDASGIGVNRDMSDRIYRSVTGIGSNALELALRIMEVTGFRPPKDICDELIQAMGNINVFEKVREHIPLFIGGDNEELDLLARELPAHIMSLIKIERGDALSEAEVKDLFDRVIVFPKAFDAGILGINRKNLEYMVDHGFEIPEGFIEKNEKLNPNVFGKKKESDA